MILNILAALIVISSILALNFTLNNFVVKKDMALAVERMSWQELLPNSVSYIRKCCKEAGDSGKWGRGCKGASNKADTTCPHKTGLFDALMECHEYFLSF